MSSACLIIEPKWLEGSENIMLMYLYVSREKIRTKIQVFPILPVSSYMIQYTNSLLYSRVHQQNARKKEISKRAAASACSRAAVNPATSEDHAASASSSRGSGEDLAAGGGRSVCHPSSAASAATNRSFQGPLRPRSYSNAWTNLPDLRYSRLTATNGKQCTVPEKGPEARRGYRAVAYAF